MSILCALGGHEAGPREIYNGGYYFARCRRCRTDMIRCGAAWETVPSGHRVVWKDGRHEHSVEPNLAGVLPVLHHDSNLPAVRSPFFSWSRDVTPLKAGRKFGGGSRAVAAALPVEREEPQYPRLLVFAALVGAGLQLILSLGSARSGMG